MIWPSDTANGSNKKSLSKIADNGVEISGNFLPHGCQKHKSALQGWFNIWRLINEICHIKDKGWKEKTCSHAAAVHEGQQTH